MKKSIFVVLAITLLFTGCSSSSESDEPVVTINHYEKISYDTAKAALGDFEQEIELRLTTDSYQKRNYSLIRENMEVDRVFVSVGDRVTEGEVLISCKSGDIADKIEEYESQIARNQLMYDHYVSLNQIETSDQYKVTIEQLKRCIDIDNLYLQELRAKLDSYSIIAEADGMVMDIAEGLDHSTVGKTKNLIQVVYSNGIFYADSRENIAFDTEAIYEAFDATSTYQMKYVSTTLQDDGKNRYTFQLVTYNDEFCTKEDLTMLVKKPTLKQVLYIPKKCVFRVKSNDYVYLIDESGFREARKVVISTMLDEYAIIESGITEGDEVVVNE